MALPERLEWLERALQGLAFWIGHRHSLFRHYPLSEGALVAEACNLIQTNIPRDLLLMPECQYKNLVPTCATLAGVAERARADLVICDSAAGRVGRDGALAPHAKYVLEVKRGRAPNALITDDILRLHALLSATSGGTRAFLIVVCEGHAPQRFVSEGKSVLGAKAIEGTTGHYRVRRTVKASASFSGKSTAHYVCLIEVFLKGQKAPVI